MSGQTGLKIADICKNKLWKDWIVTIRAWLPQVLSMSAFLSVSRVPNDEIMLLYWAYMNAIFTSYKTICSRLSSRNLMDSCHLDKYMNLFLTNEIF